jgi:hypothetical protein
VSNQQFEMNPKRTRSWSVAELVPLMLLGLVGLNILIAAPILRPSSTKAPQKTPRLSPPKPPPANKFMLARPSEQEVLQRQA